jgi:WS/DGAT/MGAT family acyltransferase
VRQLSPLEAQFLLLESPTTTSHVGALLPLDTAQTSGALSFEALADLVEARLPLAPELRERVVESPLGLGAPYGIQDPDFDLEYHLREVVLPPPESTEQLAQEVARIHARPLDRSRPRWELYLIHGVTTGAAAVYVKFHTAAIDAICGAGILTAILDQDQRPRDAPAAPWAPAPVPGAPELLARGLAATAMRSSELLAQLPSRLADLPTARDLSAVRTPTELAQVAMSTISADPAARTSEPSLPVPPTPFNGPVTPHRRLAYGQVDVADVDRVVDALGVNADTVVLALVSSALRRWLLDHDALPAIPLVAAVPGTGQSASGDQSGTTLSLSLTSLPTDVADPLARVRAVALARREAHTVPAAFVRSPSLAELPRALAGWAARALLPVSSAPGPTFNLLVTSASGPSQPMYVAGARVSGMHPISMVTDATGGMSITLCSYAGQLDFGIVVAREMVPDVRRIAGYLGDALSELVGLSAC